MQREEIGNYIHYKYSNYRKYGLKSNGKEQRFDPSVALREQKNRILQSLSNQVGESQKQDLESQINFLFALKNNQNTILQSKWSSSDIQVMSNFMESLVTQVANNLQPNVLANQAVDFSTGNIAVTANSSITFKDKETYETFQRLRNSSDLTKKNGQTREFATVQQIYRRIQELIKLRNNAEQLMDTADKNGKAFLNKLDQTLKKYKSLREDIAAAAKAEEVVFQNGNGKTYYSALNDPISGLQAFDIRGAVSQKLSYDINGLRTFTQELQDLLDMTKQITTMQAQGVIGEVIPVVSQYVWNEFQNNQAKSVQQLIAQMSNQQIVIDLSNKVVGQNRSKKITLTENVLNTKENKVSSPIQAKIGNVQLNTTYTQDKVDIKLDLEDGQPISASVKAVNLNNNIHVLKGANLLNYLQDYPTFANHYLNLTARGSQSGSKPSMSLLQQAHSVLKLTVALHALSGGLWAQDKQGEKFKTEQVNFFIVNDVTKQGQYKIYYISDLLDKISKNIDLFTLEGFDQVKTWNNAWVGEGNNRHDALRRITNLLTQLRVAQLNASISPKLLT